MWKIFKLQSGILTGPCKANNNAFSQNVYSWYLALKQNLSLSLRLSQSIFYTHALRLWCFLFGVVHFFLGILFKFNKQPPWHGINIKKRSLPVCFTSVLLICFDPRLFSVKQVQCAWLKSLAISILCLLVFHVFLLSDLLSVFFLSFIYIKPSLSYCIIYHTVTIALNLLWNTRL